MMTKMIPYIKKYKVYAILSPLLMILEVFSDVLIPIFMSKLVDIGIKNNDFNYALKMAIFMVLVAIMGMITGSLSAYFGATAGYGTGAEIRREAFSKIQKFSFKNIDTISVPSLITRITSDCDIISQVVMMGLRMAVRAPFMMIFSLYMAIRIDKNLASVFFISIPILVVFISILLIKADPLFVKVQTRIDSVNAKIQENLIGIRIVKAFNRQNFENEKFKEKNDDVRSTAMKAVSIILMLGPGLNLVILSTIIVILWRGGLQVMNGGLSSGNLLALVTYNSQILMSLMMMSFFFMQLTRGNASAKRVYEVMQTNSEIVNPENPIMEVKNGDIEFNNVDFRYFENTAKILDDVNLKIKTGQTIGIIGSTGSSKSSLVQLIPRLYDVEQGEVKIAGINVKDYDLKTLRNSVAMVLQKNTLISGTIRSNMKWGDEEANDEKIIEALKNAQAWEFVSKYENPLDYVVEQGGNNFSGGQKQRLTIARALVTDPKILILDDSMSALDVATDAKLRESLNTINKDVTKIIIAQRISSIKDCDNIIVLEHGKVEAFGTHDELLEKSSVYNEINESQMGGISE